MADQLAEPHPEQASSTSFVAVCQWTFRCCFSLAIVLFLTAWLQSSLQLAATGCAFFIAGLCAALFVPQWSGYRFTNWILIANSAAMLAPTAFRSVGGISLSDPWIMLIVIQFIMFGMGTQMSYRDFALVLRMPQGVLIGLACQFLIMPLLGVSIAWAFRFPPEIAAGVILIGSCSSGLASNVMTYLARGNLALSVTITAMATALAPLMTPMWMYVLAGSLIRVDPINMSVEIVKMVIVPILAAFVHDWLANASPRARKVVWTLTIIGAAWLIALACGGWSWIVKQLTEQATEDSKLLIALGTLPGFFSAAFVFGTLYHYVVSAQPRIDKWMPVVSMLGIVYFTLVTTAKGRDQLLDVGMWLILATFLHNVLGYLFGYLGGRMFGMCERDARTVAIEVGTQNGSMAVGIAGSLGKVETIGLAAIIFAPLMNVTGSILANYWRKTSPVDQSENVVIDPQPVVSK